MAIENTQTDQASNELQQLRAQRDRLFEELGLTRAALAAEQDSQYAAYRQLVELERLRAFDEIARGMEHQLYNALTPIEGFAELLLTDEGLIADPNTVRMYIQTILDAAQEVRDTVKSMRDFYYSTSEMDMGRHGAVSQMLSNVLNEETPDDPDPQAAGTEALSPREWDVLRLLSDGLKNREIAEALSVSENTVKTHIKAILSKLSLKNRTQAAAYALLDQRAFEQPSGRSERSA